MNDIATSISSYLLPAIPGRRCLAKDSIGKLWTVYAKPAAGYAFRQVFVAYSDDGVIWTEEQVTNIDSLSHHTAYGIAVDIVNNIHIVYTGFGRGDYTTRGSVIYRRRTPSGWDPEEVVANFNSTTFPGGCFIALDAFDNVYITWDGAGAPTNFNVFNIMFRAKVTGSWGSIEVVTDKNVNQRQPALAIDVFGRVHLIWRGSGWGTYITRQQIIYAMGPEPWSTALLTDTDSNKSNQSIALHSSELPYVAYQDGSSIYHLHDNGGVWTPPGLVISNSLLFGPNLALDRSDDPHVLFGQWDPTYTFANVMYTKLAGGTWTTPVAVTSVSGSFIYNLPFILWSKYPIPGGVSTNIPTGSVIPFVIDLDGTYEPVGQYILQYGEASLPASPTNPARGSIAHRLVAEGLI